MDEDHGGADEPAARLVSPVGSRRGRFARARKCGRFLGSNEVVAPGECQANAGADPTLSRLCLTCGGYSLPLDPIYAGKPALRASSMSGTCGRAPMCEMTSAAARLPSRPAVSSGMSLATPNRKPAA